MTKFEKTKLRAFYLKKRLLLTQAEIQQKSRQICENILQLKQTESKNFVACYLAINNEPNIQEVIDHFLNTGNTVTAPAFFNKLKGYKFVKFFNWQNLTPGPYQIPQPSILTPIDPKNIDLAFIPGLSFAKNGTRLGYGKGVYDKLMTNTNALKIGVCFDFQVIDNFNAESHDLRVDFIITEKRLIKTRNC